MKSLSVVLGGVLLAAWGCGGGSSSPPPPPVGVSLNVTSANVHLLRTRQFTATVTNATNTAVTWSRSGADCTGAPGVCGSVDTNGLYTAPTTLPSPPTVTVTATSVADPSKSASATITLLATVTIVVTPEGQNIDIETTKQYTATVQNAIDPSVSWGVTGTGCTGAACGTISATGLYTAPASVPNPAAITITATSVEDPPTTDSVAATVRSSVSVSAWPPTALVAVGDMYQYGAVVGGTTNGAVNWTLSGAGCTGAACGIVSATGMYTAPTTVPTPDTVTLTATSQVDPTKSATATVRILSSKMGKLNGAYAYLYQGFAGNAPGITSGMFMADGQGNLTYGISDRTWPDYAGGNFAGARFTGTYIIDSDNRGYLYLHSASFGDVTLAFVLNAAGDMGFVQPFFDASTRLLGRIVKQNIPAANNSALEGDYVFQWLGADYDGNRLAALGKLHANGFGSITSGAVDVNNRPVVAQDLALTGTYSVSQDGRTTMTLTIATMGTLHFVGYVLSPDHFFMSSNDPVTPTSPMWSGMAFEQTGGPFSNASLQGTGVFDMLGRPGTTQAATSAGVMTGDASGNLSGVFDSNTNGTVVNDASYTATASIREDGRGTLTSTTFPPLEFYLVSPGKALLMGTSAAGTIELGSLEPQVSMSYRPSALVGQFAEAASIAPPYSTNQTLTGSVVYSPAGSLLWNLEGNSSVAGLFSTWGTATVDSVAANGRGVLGDTAGNHSYIYMISPMKFVVLVGYIPQQAMADQNLLYVNIR